MNGRRRPCTAGQWQSGTATHTKPAEPILHVGSSHYYRNGRRDDVQVVLSSLSIDW
jgi:hypothetical protein